MDDKYKNEMKFEQSVWGPNSIETLAVRVHTLPNLVRIRSPYTGGRLQIAHLCPSVNFRAALGPAVPHGEMAALQPAERVLVGGRTRGESAATGRRAPRRSDPAVQNGSGETWAGVQRLVPLGRGAVATLSRASAGDVPSVSRGRGARPSAEESRPTAPWRRQAFMRLPRGGGGGEERCDAALCHRGLHERGGSPARPPNVPKMCR